MAQIVLGLGTSHGPQLFLRPEQWELRAAADRANPQHWFRGKPYNYETLLAARKNEDFAPHLTPQAKQAHFDRCQRAIGAIADVYRTVKPDVAIVIGNDQSEIFTEENIPAFSVFWGEFIENYPRTPEELAKLTPGIAPAEIGYKPLTRTAYPCDPALGQHIIGALIDDGFDVGQSKKLPIGPRNSNAAPHAFGYVFRRVMEDQPIPIVPVLLNTHYPPNRPKARRCLDFGRAIARAVKSFPGNARVAIIGSGGLTHYVIEEDFDRGILAAMAAGDTDAINAVDDSLFASGGTAEIKNWIPVFGAMREAGFPMKLIDYVPCYRSPAGTGNAMAFAYWRA
ncbi:MAG TPA: hypothetical protein VGP48_15340 [Stellaceae bacterium]|jgi:OH-DDVA oxygenase|nr:hypothetical protein [Stellaceae bacterium]